LTQMFNGDATAWQSYLTSLQADVQNLTSELPAEVANATYSFSDGERGSYAVNLTFPNIGTIQGEQKIIRDVAYTPTDQDLTRAKSFGRPVYDLHVDMTNASGMITISIGFFTPYSALPPKLVEFFDQPHAQELGVRVEKKISTSSGTFSSFVNWVPVVGAVKQFTQRFIELNRLWNCLEDPTVDWGSFGQKYPGQYEIVRDQVERLNRIGGLIAAWSLFTEFAAGNAHFGQHGTVGSLPPKVTLPKGIEHVSREIIEAGAGMVTAHGFEHFAVGHWLDEQISQFANLLSPWCEKIKTTKWTGTFKDYARSTNAGPALAQGVPGMYAGEGITSGQLSFDILEDGSIIGEGTGQRSEFPPWSTVQPYIKGTCLSHDYGEIRFSITGDSVVTGRYTSRATLVFSPYAYSATVHCVDLDGNLEIQEQTLNWSPLILLNKLACAGTCPTGFDIELDQRKPVIALKAFNHPSSRATDDWGSSVTPGSFSKIELYNPNPVREIRLPVAE
jgi:hypothetical protein